MNDELETVVETPLDKVPARIVEMESWYVPGQLRTYLTEHASVSVPVLASTGKPVLNEVFLEVDGMIFDITHIDGHGLFIGVYRKEHTNKPVYPVNRSEEEKQ